MKTGRRIMMVFMAMVLVLSGVVAGDLKVAVAEEKSVFLDVPLNHQYYEAIRWAKSKGISGYGDGTFKPDQQITKFELVQMHYALFGKEWFGEKEADVVAGDNSLRILNAPKGNWRYVVAHYAAQDLGTRGFLDGPVLSDKYIGYDNKPYPLGYNLNFNEGLTEERLAFAMYEFMRAKIRYGNWDFSRVKGKENPVTRAERFERIVMDNPDFIITRNAPEEHKIIYRGLMHSGYYVLADMGLKPVPVTKEDMKPRRPISRAEMAHILMKMERSCIKNGTTRARMGKDFFDKKLAGEAEEIFSMQEIANPD